MARLRERYQKDIAPALAKEFGIKNPMAVPRLDKIVVNMGMGEAIANAKVLDTAVEELKAICSGPQLAIELPAALKWKTGCRIDRVVGALLRRFAELQPRV